MPDKSQLELTYTTSAEASYTKIQVSEGILRHTFFHDQDNRCAQWFKSTPCWTEADLNTENRTLNDQEWQHLAKLVQNSGILALKQNTFGETNLRRRAYTETLQIRLGQQEKTLRYRSTPEAEAKPEAFAKIEQALLNYAK